MGVLWIIFCSTTDKKNQKKQLSNSIFKAGYSLNLFKKLKKNKNSQF